MSDASVSADLVGRTFERDGDVRRVVEVQERKHDTYVVCETTFQPFDWRCSSRNWSRWASGAKEITRGCQ